MKQKRGYPFWSEEKNAGDSNAYHVISGKFLEEYFVFLKNPENVDILPFLKKMQMKVSDHSFPLEKLFDNDHYMINFLMECLKENTFGFIQHYVCWILASLLVSDTISFEKILYEKGIFQNLFDILKKQPNLCAENNEFYLQILWVFGNFFGCDEIPFDEISIFYPELCNMILQNINKENCVMSIWLIANILKGNILMMENDFRNILLILINLLHIYGNEDENISLDIYSIISKYICKK